MRAELNDRVAKSAAPGIYFDTDKRSPPGFLLRVTPAGARAWCLNYRVKDSLRERRLTIGATTVYTIGEARKRAAELRRIVNEGGDPLHDLETARAEPTVSELAERFYEEALPSRAPRTASEYRAMLDKHVLPAIGRLKVSGVEPEDIAKLHRRLSSEGKKRRADAVVTVASLLFGWAVKQKIISDNPCKGAVERNSPPGRERYLSTDELDRLLQTLERWRERKPDSTDALLLLLLTGARRAEVLGIAWDQIDLNAGVWVKPASLVKQRKLHRVPLAPEAVAVLRRRLERHETPVRSCDCAATASCSAGGAGAHVIRLERDWRVIRVASAIEDLRVHDLRHSYASLLVSQGLSLPIIGALLGHARPATTARYSHLADAPLREATAIGGRIMSRRNGKPQESA